MKNTINFFYNLIPDEIEENDEEYSFLIDYEYYFLVPYERPVEDLPTLENISLELLSHNVKCHTMIRNRNNELLSSINDKSYILLKTNTYENTLIRVKDICLVNNNIFLNQDNSKLYRNNWGDLWSKKIDFFEYQVRELGKDKKVVINSFSYYVGLAENAISYYNDTINEFQNNINERTAICHRRIKSPNLAIDFYNPLNYVIDYEVRDIAEYVKSSFFNNSFSYEDLDSFFNIRMVTPFTLRLLYSRLLFPSYYFDVYDSVMNKDLSDEALLDIIDKIDEYEDFLLEIYNYLNKFLHIPEIEWINKKL